MKNNILSLVILLLAGCSDSGIQPSQEEIPISENLLSNSSFEFDNIPSLKDWNGRWLPDSSWMYHFTFSNDAPPDGGQWSLAIHTEREDLWAQTDVNAIVACDYQLSVWTKTNAPSAEITLYVSQEGSNVFHGRVVSFTNSEWQICTVILDSATVAQVPDSIRILRVQLTANREPFKTAAITNFDLVELKALK